DVAAPLRVVRLRGEELARKTPRALEVPGMEVVDLEIEASGVAADLVEGDEPEVAVEGRVLDTFRHHGRGRLLEREDEGVVAALLEQEDRGEAGMEARLRDRLAVEPVDIAGVRVDVGAVDGERREGRGQVELVLDVGQPRLQPLRLRLERRRG